MAIDITAEVTIDRKREDVAWFAMDPENDPVWIGGIVEAKMVTEPPFGRGTKVARVAKFLGRRMEYTPEVLAYEPGKLLEMSTDVPFEMTIRYEFEDADGGTLARIRVQGEGSGFYRLASPLLARMVKRNVSRDLRTLKRLLEASADTI
ncbi:MAG: SRPBCC family protein [Chloroflexi bacterium]|nr:SRPBCC family protein [Chloroflexota bacterium]